MFRRWITLLLALLLTSGAWAQTATLPGSTEAQSLNALRAIFNDPNSQPATFDSAVDAFRQQFPHSKNTLLVLVTAVRYHRIRQEFLPELRYGVAALKLDPHILYVLSSLGQAIPDNVSTTDLNLDQLLEQAESYDQQVLAITLGFHITAQGLDFAGIHYSPTIAHRLQDNLAGPAYVSRGRIAALRGQYEQAVASYKSALAYQPEAAVQAETYYHMGQAEVQAQQTVAAKADLAKARTLAPTSQILQRLIQIEETKLAGGNR
ncbi:MAG: hypothetical protein ACRD04_14225 [Terriglobales bacterium]